jgi:hypothetical protein
MVKNRNTAGKCCWPAQEWSRALRRCVGAPKCPAGLSADGDGCRCPGGQAQSADTAGHCCWPKQVWSSARKVCVGVPACPAPMVAQGEACVSAPEGQDDLVSAPPLVEASMPEDWSDFAPTPAPVAAKVPVPAVELSLADTVVWLKKILPEAASFTFTHRGVDMAGRDTESVIVNSLTSVEGDGCSLTLKGGPEGQGVPDYLWLANVDPAALRTERIQDASFSVVSGGVVTPQAWWVTGTGARRLVFPDQETASRVEKALRHAAELCGSK